MEKSTRGWLGIALGIAIVVVMAAVALAAGAGFWAYRSFAPSAAFVDQMKADQEFERIRARFKDQTPLLVADPHGHGSSVRAEGRAPFTGQLDSLHVAAYEPHAGKLVRFTVPFWLIRLGHDGHVSLGNDVFDGVRGAQRLTVKELEALGPGLLIDEHKADGDRVIVWTQ